MDYAFYKKASKKQNVVSFYTKKIGFQDKIVIKI